MLTRRGALVAALGATLIALATAATAEEPTPRPPLEVGERVGVRHEGEWRLATVAALASETVEVKLAGGENVVRVPPSELARGARPGDIEVGDEVLVDYEGKLLLPGSVRRREKDRFEVAWAATNSRFELKALFCLPLPRGAIARWFHRGRPLAFSRDGRFVVAQDGAGGPIAVLRVGQRAPVATFGEITKRVLALSPDARLVAVMDGKGGVELREVETGRHVAAIADKKAEIVGATFSPDGATLAAYPLRGGPIPLFRVPSGEALANLDGPEEWRPLLPASNLTFSPDGRSVAACVLGRIGVWSVQGGRWLGEVNPSLSDPIAGLHLSLDAKTLYAWTWGDQHPHGSVINDKSFPLCDVASGEILGGVKTVAGLAFTPDSTTLVTGSNPTYLYEARTAKLVATLPGATLALAPDGKTVATTEGLFAVPTGRRLATFEPKLRENVGTFTPDSKRFVGTTEEAVRVFDAATGAPSATFEGGGGWIGVSGDGKRIATNGHGGIVIWDLELDRRQ
ncbi:MAG: WD40 repeat domain-containing protein [Planctomycetota bacterium]